MHLARCRRYRLIDCQLETAHLRSMGAVTIERSHYTGLLDEFTDRADERHLMLLDPRSVMGTERLRAS